MTRDGPQRNGWIGIVKAFAVVDLPVDGIELQASERVPVPVQADGMAEAPTAENVVVGEVGIGHAIGNLPSAPAAADSVAARIGEEKILERLDSAELARVATR